jgi:DNA-damage-inducible protein D
MEKKQKALERSQWRRFAEAAERAKQACENSGIDVNDHFADVGKMVSIGPDAERKIEIILNH